MNALQTPELTREASSSVRIPELRSVALTTRIRRLLDHPDFQRLRRVRQLGPIHLVYPGAVHTRFEHSIGVFDYVRAYVMSLFATPAFAASVTQADVEAVLLAGLLHDVGHYPFAHNLEALHLKGRDTPRHEDVGAQIIGGKVKTFRGSDPPMARLMERDFDVDVERVLSLCTGKNSANASQMDRILRSILSSAIDADKMDYLERDSIHMGVPYGRNYDRARLIESLTLNQAEDHIAITAKGKVSAEIFIFGRYTMFSEAYWHHTVRSASSMVEAALAAFHSRTDIEYKDFLQALLSHDDAGFLRWIQEQMPPNSATRYLLAPLSNDQRGLYKRIATYSRVYVEQDKQRAYQRIYEMEASALYDLTDRIRTRLGSLVGRSLHPADVIIDTPPRDKDTLETVELVYPGASGERYYRLDELSRVVAGVQNDFMMVVKKIRIFVHPGLAQDLANLKGLDEILLGEIL